MKSLMSPVASLVTTCLIPVVLLNGIYIIGRHVKQKCVKEAALKKWAAEKQTSEQQAGPDDQNGSSGRGQNVQTPQQVSAEELRQDESGDASRENIVLCLSAN